MIRGLDEHGYVEMVKLESSVKARITRVIERAARHDIQLSVQDFIVEDGLPTIDGMDPGEWLDALTMD